jgi:arginyl-tRNA synthetase
MLAWQKFGNGETPASTGMKGDHLVGKYYVMFDKVYKQQVEELIASGATENDAKNNAPVMKEAREMLLKWEAGDKEVVDLWKTMNSWVYAGFHETYSKLGVDFDHIYYESETYKLGKEIVLEALDKKILYQNDDSSIWADLSAEGLDQKLLLRSDGTAVYMTQDLGTAVERHKEYNFDRNIYVVGNEQNYHFQVLRAILKKMGYPWADGLIHFSYGMVELPEGKMKSREGTVVDADDLIEEMHNTAREVSNELGKLQGFTEEEKEEIFRKIGLGALKYYILKVDPKKNMTFNPKESIDFNGNTGPFIQYTYARIQSVFRKGRTDEYQGRSGQPAG